jgi:nucleoside-diphosphate-sugar epimerase
MKFLLLGGAGYLGRTLTKLLYERGQEVIVFDKFKYSNPNDLVCQYIKDDISNIVKYLDKLNNIDYVFYMASPRFNEIKDDLHITSEILLMEHALRCVKKISPNFKLVFFSSCSVYGNTKEIVNEESILIPTTMYSKLKIEGENHILNSGYDNFLIVRLATLYGLGEIDRNDLLINNIIKDVKENKEIQIYESEAYRPNLNVSDCAEIIYKIISQNIKDKIINVGFNEFNISKIGLIQKIENSINKKIKVDYVDDGLEFRSYYVNFDRIKKYLEDFNPKSYERGVYELFLKDKVVFGLEDYDSILQAPRPNGSSRTWYLEEEGQMDIPKMWGVWNLMDIHSNYKLFSKETFKDQVSPNFYEEYVTYKYQSEINSQNYIYLISVYDPNFFIRNEKIGFKCISKKYIDDVKRGICKIVLLNGIEGYIGCENNNDLEILNEWIKEINIPFKSVYLLSGNLIIDEVANSKNIQYKCIPISIFDNWINYHEIKKMSDIVSFQPKDNNYLYLSYNRNVRYHRLHFLSKALFRGLLDIGKISLNTFPYDENLSEDNPMNLLQKRAPLIIDRPLDINWSNTLGIEDHIETFMSVVTESLTDKNTLFLSEKIWKPIACGHPFMVLGGKGTLKKLKEFGFKTFDKWFDESYDNVDEMEIRSDMILDEIEKYKNKTIDELKQIREEMKETCLHNNKTFLNMITTKYTFDGENMNHFKEILSIINQIKLNVI